ncbi:MAG: gamma-glutamylcyclotransferase [Leptolyngbyaceae cyanobacterium SM2_5_2]|nr:gamma-glutamylcyclotransferase [Leptolyngbyaceae cyanobacterium SM2_5_2]
MEAQSMVCQLFVYGTLKPGERAFQPLCQAYVVGRVDAISPGRLYHLPLGYPALTLEAGWVQGVLLTLSTSTILPQLDEFEDYYPNHPQDSQYQRLYRWVYRLDRTPLAQAWIYVMAKDRVDQLRGQWLPRGVWTRPKNCG